MESSDEFDEFQQDSEEELDLEVEVKKIGTYSIYDLPNLKELVLSMINEVVDLLAISSDDAWRVLQLFKWNLEKLKEKFFEEKVEILKKSGI